MDILIIAMIFAPAISTSCLISQLFPYKKQKLLKYSLCVVSFIIWLAVLTLIAPYCTTLAYSILNLSLTGIGFIDGMIAFFLILVLVLLFTIYAVFFCKLIESKRLAFAFSVIANVKYSGGKYSDCDFNIFQKIYIQIKNDDFLSRHCPSASTICEIELAELILTTSKSLLIKFYRLPPEVQASILLMRSIKSQGKSALDYACYTNVSSAELDRYRIDYYAEYCDRNLWTFGDLKAVKMLLEVL